MFSISGLSELCKQQKLTEFSFSLIADAKCGVEVRCEKLMASWNIFLNLIASLGPEDETSNKNYIEKAFAVVSFI